jgi:hypothetical protein
MTPKFLREEASRFRGMAITADLDASKLRLLSMATDFESRATAADELAESKLAEGESIGFDRQQDVIPADKRTKRRASLS